MSSLIKSKWNYEEGLFSDLLKLCDGTIVTDDDCSFHVHKVILARRSSFFKALFCGMDSDKAEHRISNMNGDCLKEILNYIYSDDICVTEANVNDLLVAADYFFLEDLKLILLKYVKENLTDDNILKFCCTSYQIDEKEILQSCFIYIERRFQMIIGRNRGDLIHFPKELLKNILKSRNLNVDNERTVWKAIVYWAEADIQSRLKDVPSLLATLAMGEIGTDLATDIINHDIVLKNLHMKSLIVTCAKYLNDFGSNGHLILSLLLKDSNNFPLKNLRIPARLNIVSKYIVERNISEIYVSYDGTLDLWSKIIEMDIYSGYLAAIGWNIFVFDIFDQGNLYFDLRTMEQKSMQQMRGIFSSAILAIGYCIYRIGLISDNTSMDEYDTVINRWFHYELLNKPLDIKAVAIKENIFVVGADKNNMTEMVALVFNSVTKQRMFLTSPNIFRYGFLLAAYHEKIYLIGGKNRRNEEVTNVEVFSPAENLWKEVQPIPFADFAMSIFVFNDQLIVYIVRPTENQNPVAVRWNGLKECWEPLERSEIVDFRIYSTCTIDDTEKLQFLTKQNRKSDVQITKSPFCFL